MIAVEKTYTTKIELAMAFDTSRVSIDNWTRHPDFPGGRDGPWEHDAVAEFLTANGSPIPTTARHERQGSSSHVGHTKAAAEALKTREQYRKIKLDNDIREGKLVYADEVAQRCAEMLLRIKHRLESIPDEMAMTFPESTRPGNLADCKRYVHGLLKEMSQWKPIGDNP